MLGNAVFFLAGFFLGIGTMCWVSARKLTDLEDQLRDNSARITKLKEALGMKD